MFDNVPNVRQRFTKVKADQEKSSLIADEMFLAHSHAVILALDQAIGLLDDPTKLKMKMTTLVKMHVHQNPPIGSEYFEPFASSSHTFAMVILGLPEDHPEVQAWVKFLYAFRNMVKAEEDALGGEAATEKARTCCTIL
ncbi:haemoglobin type 2 [Plakobranchus ocellatus]|uniref:Globin n=1 Tax=Plakobranchus ocellatus TaxID=259542 RepID=A0AAV3YC35_9GAST|nr:haemoglobin type 2 [Plakobranchus ocellatus]